MKSGDNGRRLFAEAKAHDAIRRTPGALTLESTYQAFYGAPEVYITAVYRWPDAPTAGYLLANASTLGNRLGRNKLILPVHGSEEGFWQDAVTFFEQIQATTGKAAELRSDGVYLLLSRSEPRALVDGASPFIVCDISELVRPQLVGLFSKLLDLFHVALDRAPAGRSPGAQLLAGQPPGPDNGVGVAIDQLAEIHLVLGGIVIDWFCFPWAAGDAFTAAVTAIRRDPARAGKIRAVQDRLAPPHPRHRLTATVFISYRREDSRHVADRVYDRLAHRYGRDAVFKDVDSIPLGRPFPDVLGQALGQARVVLAFIGRRWTDARDSAGRRRLEDPDDFVRAEIEAALALNITIIPLLVDDASMPASDVLPASLRPLTEFNGMPVRGHPDFEHDVNQLINTLDQLV